MVYVLIFSLPRKSQPLGVKVNRMLKEVRAEKIQNSVWRSDDLRGLTSVAVKIRNAGGFANVLEEKVVY